MFTSYQTLRPDADSPGAAGGVTRGAVGDVVGQLQAGRVWRGVRRLVGQADQGAGLEATYTCV